MSGAVANLNFEAGLAYFNNKVQIQNGLQVGSLRTAISTKSAAYTIGINDYTILVNATSSSINITLLNASVAGSGAIRVIKKIDNSTNKVTVLTTGVQKIDGEVEYNLSSKNKFVTIQSDGTNWNIIGNN